MAKQRVVVLGMPTGKTGECHTRARDAFLGCGANSLHFDLFCHGTAKSSVISHTCNELYANALTLRRKLGATHFAMLHSDVCPDRADWLDVLADVMHEQNADLVSAVVPVRNNSGLTSTMEENPDDGWRPKGLSLKEVYSRPPSFSSPGLLVNTGMMLLKLRDWCTKLVFRECNAIPEMPDGSYQARIINEDHELSRQVRGFGGHIVATRAVPLYHGHPDHHNRNAWGYDC